MQSRYSEKAVLTIGGVCAGMGTLAIFGSFPLAIFAAAIGVVASNNLMTDLAKQYSMEIGEKVGKQLNSAIFSNYTPSENFIHRTLETLAINTVSKPLTNEYTSQFGKAITGIIDRLDKGEIALEPIITYYPPKTEAYFTLSPHLLTHQSFVTSVISGNKLPLSVTNFQLENEINGAIKRQLGQWTPEFFSRSLAQQIKQILEKEKTIAITYWT